jgi:outer membrane immunogenic protein
MRRFTLVACAALLAVSMATPSIAADIVAPRPIYKGPAYVAPVFTWTGFYVGLNAGYGFGNSAWSGGGLGTGNFSTNGWLIGGTLGYNLQTGNWVWGVEGDIDWSKNKGTHACGGGTCETTNTWLGTARGRVGYAFDRFLPYITGGAALGNVQMNPPGAGDDNEMKFGWTFGGGVEWAFLSSWSAKLEYLYTDLGTAKCNIGACGVGSNVKFNTSVVRAGINYRW